MEKIEFISEDLEKIKNNIKKDNFKEKVIINFINAHGIYHYTKTPKFYESIRKSEKSVLNFIDSSIVSFLLKGKRIRGPGFTRALLEDKEIFQKNKHLFIGFGEKDLDNISKQFGIKRENLFGHVSEYTKTPRDKYNFKEDRKEIKRIAKIINKINPQFVWIGISNPRQEIMAKELYTLIKSKYIINVGAAFDFITEKKKEAPKIFQKSGLEWFYRLITDPKNSKKKIKTSFIGTIYTLKYAKKIKGIENKINKMKEAKN